MQSENVAAVPASGVTSNTGEEAFVKKLWETKDVHYLWDHFYIVDSTTSVKRKLFPVERLLKRDMKLPVQNGKKQILIYHTHGASESFSDSRSGKVADGVIGVGEKLAKELEKNGYGVIHDTTKYDWMDGKIDRSKAYNVSLAGVQNSWRKIRTFRLLSIFTGILSEKIGIRIRQLMENGRRLPCFLME